MVPTATASSALEALHVVIYVDGEVRDAVVTRKALVALVGEIPPGNDQLLTAFNRHRDAVQELVVTHMQGSKRPIVVVR